MNALKKIFGGIGILLFSIILLGYVIFKKNEFGSIRVEGLDSVALLIALIGLGFGVGGLLTKDDK